MRSLMKFLAGCFTVAASALLPSVADAQDKELNLFAWSEYVPQSVIDGFTKETGIKVNYETYASNEEMLNKLLAGAASYDLIQPSTYTIESLIKLNKLEALDKGKLTNFKNLAPEFTNLPHDPGNKYSVPWMAGTVCIVVNTDKVKDEITGYTDIFQDKFKGRIVTLDDSREFLSWVLNTQGKDVNTITPEVLEGAKPTMAKWMKLVKVYDSDSPKTAMLNGDVDLGIVWSGEAALLYQENKKFKFVLPKEGVDQFVDSLCIPVGAPHKDNAHLFINYILRPEVSKLISDDFPYTNPNVEARKLLSDDQRNNPASYPTGTLPKMVNFKDIGQSAGDIDQLFTDLKSGS